MFSVDYIRLHDQTLYVYILHYLAACNHGKNTHISSTLLHTIRHRGTYQESGPLPSALLYVDHMAIGCEVNDPS